MSSFSHPSHTIVMNPNRPQPIYLIPGPYARFACSLSRPAPFKSIANMPRTPSLEDIDSMPYHALQAEAAKHSIRRNLGAAKLREALKRLLGSNPDPADLPPAWFIASAKPAPAPATGKAPKPARPTKTNARITAAAQKNKAPLPPPASSSEASRARRSQHPPSPDASAPATANSPRPSASPSTPASRRAADRPSRPPLNRATSSSPLDPAVPPAPRASTSQVPVENVAHFFRGYVDDGKLRGDLIPPSTYTNVTGPGSQALPDAIRREAQRLGLPRSITQPNLDFLSFLIRDTLEELDRGKFISVMLRASRVPVRNLPRQPAGSPSHPVETTSYHNHALAPSPVNSNVPWDAEAPPAAPESTRPPSTPRPNQSQQPQISTPPPGLFHPPSLDSLDLPREKSRTIATERLNLSDTTEPQSAQLRIDDLLESSLSETSEEEAQSRSYVENLLSVETAFLPPDSVTPSRRKRREAEEEFTTTVSNKKLKLTPTPPPPGPSGANPPAPASQSVAPMSPTTPPMPATQPSKPLKFFPSAKKAPVAPLDSPSPLSSPECAPSQPTLYGTESHYVDNSTTRFSELLRGSTRLLPSPPSRQPNPSTQNNKK